MNRIQVVVLGIRTGVRADDIIEVLCLDRGVQRRYRLSISPISLERFRLNSDDLSFEFDTIPDADISAYLIESLWRLEVSEADVLFGCEMLRRLEVSDLGLPLITVDDGFELFGKVISTVVEQFRTLRSTDSEALATIERLEATFRNIHKSAMLTSRVRDDLRNARLAMASIRSAIELQQIRSD